MFPLSQKRMQSIGKNLSDLGQMLNKAMIKLIKFNNLFKITSIHNTNTCPCRKKRPKKTHLTRQSMFLVNPMFQIHKLFKTISFNRKMSIAMHSWAQYGSRISRPMVPHRHLLAATKLLVHRLPLDKSCLGMLEP